MNRKVFTTENSYRSHVQSKKHRENELSAASPTAAAPTPGADSKPTVPPAGSPLEPSRETGDVGILAKLAASRNRLSTDSCLFCNHSSTSIETNVQHMERTHGFFIPDTEYLVDLPGLLTYLGEKVAVRNVCLYCNGKGRGLHSLDAVRKHMHDKSHCKIAYDSTKDRLEISDYYDFTPSYALLPAGARSRAIRNAPRAPPAAADDEEEWEDDEEVKEEEADEVVEEEEDELDPTESRLAYGDTPYELVLPSGARIGHRSMRRYYAQSFKSPLSGLAGPDANSGSVVLKRLLADKESHLIPASGAGFGAFGNGTMTMKARNRGEAREAGRHIREHRDSRKQEAFRTKIGFISNHQKHFRDPLLQ